MAALWPQVTLGAVGALVVWILIARVTRMVSAASIAAAVALPLSLVALRLAGWPAPGFSGAWPFLLVTILMGALVIVRHRANLARILAGTENRMGSRPDRNSPRAEATPDQGTASS
jgi:glycerol-3-phosphate acyltransferase PlsY